MLAQLTRTAVYGPVRTVVWQGSAGDRGPYADQVGFEEVEPDGYPTFGDVPAPVSAAPSSNRIPPHSVQLRYN
jgi:hypothetical protein